MESTTLYLFSSTLLLAATCTVGTQIIFAYALHLGCIAPGRAHFSITQMQNGRCSVGKLTSASLFTREESWGWTRQNNVCHLEMAQRWHEKCMFSLLREFYEHARTYRFRCGWQHRIISTCQPSFQTPCPLDTIYSSVCCGAQSCVS